MNIENWIEENTDWLVCCEEDIQVVPVSELRELLKTNAIVPREPSDEMIKYGHYSWLAGEGKRVSSCYKAMIKASEEEE